METKIIPVKYTSKFIEYPDILFHTLRNKLNWKRFDSVPRSEYYINKAGNYPYTYGEGRGQRKYEPQPSILEIDELFDRLFQETHTKYDICFLNYYLDQKDHLGWHSDDSLEIDDNRPIAVISLGTEREIWFRPKEDKSGIEKLKLEKGSLCIMDAHMQETYLHRIPKASFQCGERISLTFRGFSL